MQEIKWIKGRGIIHSQKEKGIQDVIISAETIDKSKSDFYYAKVGNKICSAYNVFVGHYYVDDIYGVLSETISETKFYN